MLTAHDNLVYNENEIRRIAIKGFDIAMKRRKKVTYVHSLLPDSPLPLLLRSFSIIWRNPEHLPYLQM